MEYFDLVVSSLNSGYAVTIFSDEEKCSSDPFPVHKYYNVKSDYLAVRFLGDCGDSALARDFFDDQFSDELITRDIYNVDESRLIDVLFVFLCGDVFPELEVVIYEGSLIEKLTQNKLQFKIFQDRYKSFRLQEMSEEENRILPQSLILRDWFAFRDNREVLKRLVEKVYFANRKSGLFDGLSAFSRGLKDDVLALKKRAFPSCSQVDMLLVGLAAFGYTDTSGPLFYAAHRIVNSDVDLSVRNNWDNFDLALLVGLRIPSGIGDVLFNIDVNQRDLNVQLRALNIAEIIPGGFFLYNLFPELVQYMAEFHPDIPYQKAKAEDKSVELRIEVSAVKIGWASLSGNRDFI
jgi:hypothetical protein